MSAYRNAQKREAIEKGKQVTEPINPKAFEKEVKGNKKWGHGKRKK